MTVDGIPPANRQCLIKDLKVIEILCEVLYYPFKAKWFQINEVIQYPLLLKIFQLAYRLIKHTIREYRPNELYASQWVDLFMMHAMQCDQENDLFAEPTLTELIDNNKVVLENRIQRETISSFVEMLTDREKHQKYVNILRALVNCDGEAVVSNQGEISRLLLDNEQTKSALIFNLRKANGRIEIQVYNDWIDLYAFPEISEEKDGGKLLYYFTSMILLLSDLCLDRNFTAISPLSDLYPYELCNEILCGPYDLATRNSFVRLMTQLWIDRDFSEIQLPNKVRIWNQLDNQ